MYVEFHTDHDGIHESMFFTHSSTFMSMIMVIMVIVIIVIIITIIISFKCLWFSFRFLIHHEVKHIPKDTNGSDKQLTVFCALFSQFPIVVLASFLSILIIIVIVVINCCY